MIEEKVTLECQRYRNLRKIHYIWKWNTYRNNEIPIGCKPISSARLGHKIQNKKVSKNSARRVQAIYKLIRENLVEALTSDDKFIRTFAEEVARLIK